MLFKYKLLLISILLISCNSKQSNISQKKTNKIEAHITKSISNGFFKKLNENIFVAIYQNNVYLFSESKNYFKNNKIGYILKKKDGTTKEKKIATFNSEINHSDKGIYAPLSVVYKRVNIDNYNYIEIGEFTTNEVYNYKWSYKLDLTEVFEKWSRYQNEFKSIIKTNLLQINFEKALKYGVFFKNPHGFYILIDMDDIYFITNTKEMVEDKFMLHLIKEDNSFINRSFKFKDFDFSNFLEKPYKNLIISRVNIDTESLYHQLRIGQYNNEGNIWVQQFFLGELFSNDLLRHKNELNGN